MGKHSTLVGSSSCERIINCPGSSRLSAGVPKDTGSSYANEGSMLHAVMEKLLTEDGLTPEELVGFKMLGHELTDALVTEMIEPALEQFDDLIKDMGGDLDYEIEARVGWPDDPVLAPAFGTGDVFGSTPSESLYLDWKFGRGVEVEAENNYQGMFCAAAARHTPAVKDMFRKDKPIRIVFVQPAFGGYSEWVVTHEELDIFEVMLRNAVRSALSDDAPLETGKWCRWCPAQPICPLKNELAGYALGQDLETEFTAAELGELVQLAYEVEQWADTVLAMAHKQLELGHHINGYKLVAKRSTGRVVIDEDKLKAAMQRKRIKVDEFMPRKMGGIGLIQKALKAHGIKGDEMESFIANHFQMKPSSGNTMVPSDDKRPAVVLGESGIEQLASKLSGLNQE